MLPGLPDPATLATKALVEGVVVDASTSKPAAGALVTMEAWPSSGDLARLKPGDVVPTVVIAKAQVQDDGSYQLKVGKSPVAQQFIKDGKIDVNIVVHSLSEPTVFAQSLDVAVPTGGEGIEPAPGTTAPTINLKATKVASLTAVLSQADTIEHPRYDQTYWVYQKSLGTTPAQIEHVAGLKAKSWVSWTVTNKASTSSTIGIALSTSGLAGFSASGTQSVTNSQTATWSGQRATSTADASYRYYLTVEYGLYQMWESSSHGYFPDRPTSQYKAAPIRLAGNSINKTTVPNATNCNTYSSGVKFESTQATTFSQGVNLSALSNRAGIGLNFSVSSKSGRSVSQSVAFSQDSTHKTSTYKVCGVVSYPDRNNPGALVVK